MTNEKLPQGTPLQAEVPFDRFPLGRLAAADERNAICETIAAYLRALVFCQCDDPAQKFRLNEVFVGWPTPDKSLPYPCASISDEEIPHGAHNFVPTTLDETLGCYGENTILWKTSELEAELQVDFWTTAEGHREAIAAALPRAFSPGEGRFGVLLQGDPRYFDRPVRATLVSVDRVDTPDSTWENERRLRVVIRAEMDVVHLREVSQLLPNVVLTDEEI